MKTGELNESDLGRESIGKLILRYAVPSIVSLLTNSLYNIVDQIFIGQGVGYYGNAATNVAFPMVTVCLALGLLIGNGNAAHFSLKLGSGRRDQAEQATGNAFTMALIAGALIFIFGNLFLEPLLKFFGSNAEVLPYAMTYAGICLWGLPFVVVSLSMENSIRADGSPRYAMFSTLTGAVINTILDPVFIFVFDWGVAGAAWATVIGQIVVCLLTLNYLRRFKLITFRAANLRLKGQVCKTVCALGTASFFTQSALFLLQIVMNNSLTQYGAQSVYGEVIPLACMGIVMKVNQILIAFVIGVSIGVQPIIGYNYGAGNYHRVKEAYFKAVIIATVITVAGFLAFELIPEKIINIFGEEDQSYMTFAVKCFRIYLLMIFTAGYQIISANFFQAIGKPLRAAALTLTRQVLFLIPLIRLLGYFFGLEGLLYAGPVADVVSAVVTFFFISKEIKNLGQEPALE
ncbi:MAG: MATE family efflux transporter [Peptococcaceae bacterium]|nr:MATE family efflux transporter [Peptococcaceae bacterium]